MLTHNEELLDWSLTQFRYYLLNDICWFEKIKLANQIVRLRSEITSDFIIFNHSEWVIQSLESWLDPPRVQKLRFY